jgi:hypothetical protein
MPFPFLSLREVLAFDDTQREDYFTRFAQHSPDAPRNRGVQYAIRVGSHTLHSDDTYDLKLRFNRLLNLKRKGGRRGPY